MSYHKKDERNAAALALSVAVAFCFASLMFLWLFLYNEGSIVFDMPGGQTVNIEYGSSYEDNVSARVIVPVLEKELAIECRRAGQVDTSALGSSTLTYTASFLGKSRSVQRTVNVVDTTAPEIRLTTVEGYEADWLEGYREEGYSAVDLRDGDISGKVAIKRGDGYIEYSVSDSSGNIASAVRKIEYRKNLPVITLNGGDQYISARPCYQDPGGFAVDGQGNDCSSLIEISGQVDSRRAGEYRLVYSLKNSSGDSVSASRKVTVQCEACPDEQLPEEKTIYLTFDDGPGPYTDALLDVLDAYGAKATFFISGNGGRYNDCIKRAHEAGHSIGVHSYSHNYGYIYSSEDNFFNDFNAAQQLIFDQTGGYSQLYRFPGGSSNTVSRFNHGIISRLSQSLEEMGYRYFDWNVDSCDAGGARNSATVAANIINGCSGKHCAVVLQHDIKSFSVNAVEAVLQWGIENGYSFSALELSSPCTHQHISN